jgi:hypothetical protein
MNRFDKGSSSAYVYDPQTEDEYEIGCYWRYSYCPATREEPEELEFSTYAHEVTAINGEKRTCELPDWIDWEDYERDVYEKELGQ